MSYRVQSDWAAQKVAPAHSSTISEKKKQMSHMPLYEYLRKLPKEITADHTSLLTLSLPPFLEILGYSGSRIFFDFLLSLSQGIRADAIVAEDRGGQPWLIVEVKTFNAMRQAPKEVWQHVLHTHRKFLTSDASLVLFSPKNLGIADRHETTLYDLSQLKPEHAQEIYRCLRQESRLTGSAAHLSHSQTVEGYGDSDIRD